MSFYKVEPELIRRFKELHGRMTTAEVMRAALEIGCHSATIYRYMKGEVKKQTFGERLLRVLHEQIAKRPRK